ncbi:MAG: sensor histidine kinase [Bryobacteraceae bacterium]|nr:sensor histidine kinase [Bryobacteraceae bacterium]
MSQNPVERADESRAAAQSWPALALAFGALLVLIGLGGAALDQQVRVVSDNSNTMETLHRERERELARLEVDIYASALFARDFLLSSPGTQDVALQQWMAARASQQQRLTRLEELTDGSDRERIRELRRTLDRAFDVAGSILDWNPAERGVRGPDFIRQELLPRRQNLLRMAAELADLEAADYRKNREAVKNQQKQLRRRVRQYLIGTLLFGMLIAGASIARLLALERRTERYLRQIEQSGQELRSLSQRLVGAQEEERKSLSRELHDEVGQILTALRFELSNLEQSRGADGEFETHLREARRLNEQTLRSVRDMAMGLRPSMLDDLGLVPALQYQAREFTRRTNIPVDLQVSGDVEGLSDRHRTGLYRIAQEALTNCARHARARHVWMELAGGPDRVRMSIRDDGVGLTPGKARTGIGLIGIGERVHELGGLLDLKSEPGRGLEISIDIPVRSEVRV